MARYYIHDLEDDKLHLHTAGKADWNSLPEDVKTAVKGSFVWSGARGCWLGRRKGKYAWCLDKLKANGFEDRGEQGERLSFVEQVQTEQQKAAARAERMEDRHERAEAESRSAIRHAIKMTQCIPMGQPILVGHHSERRHRALLKRSDNAMRRGVEAGKKAAYYERRADNASCAASGEKFTDPRYLGNRIEEEEKNERECLRILAKTPGGIPTERQAEAIGRIRERLEFYRGKLAETGHVWTRETLKGKQAVKIRGRWEPIVKLNPKTVAVPNICFPDPVHQKKWALKYLYTEVQDAK